jgi:hypothetical protein
MAPGELLAPETEAQSVQVSVWERRPTTNMQPTGNRGAARSTQEWPQEKRLVDLPHASVGVC